MHILNKKCQPFEDFVMGDLERGKGGAVSG